jgi:hypothetical protein
VVSGLSNRACETGVPGSRGPLRAVTVVYPGQVTWYETPRVPVPLDAKTLLSWGGGLIDSIESSPFESWLASPTAC